MLVAKALAGADYVLVTPYPPDGWQLITQPLKERIRHYKKAGLRGVVVHYSTDHVGGTRVREDSTAPVIAVPPTELPAVLQRVKAVKLPVVAHAPTAAALPHLHELAPRLGMWMHELLAVDYRRLACDFTTPQLNAQRGVLDADNAALQHALEPVFADEAVPLVFASDHQRRHANHDVGTAATNAHIIPHHVAHVPQLARVREPAEARSILLMTNSDEPHAGGDIAVRALEILSSRRGFNNLNVTVLGGGSAAVGSPLATMRNVTVLPAQPGPTQRAAASFDHGVLLSPSRWNTHDLVLADAMAQGMVAITHPVGGTPEYADESCALLPRAGDPRALADALWELVEHPGTVPSISARAIQRVTSQCGWPATTERDVKLIRGLAR